ncbi:MAG: glutamyl-tRNA reductase [Deltaproteobacteria bacterium]|nr:glutamyl-tRNA reductase [Deltaproteobacteria bacterium]
MDIIVVGLSHKTAPIELREKLFFPTQDLRCSLERLINLPAIDEALILSTCNRVEILSSTQHVENAINEIKTFLADYHGLSLKHVAPHLYAYSGINAVKHVFRVASSLDSMVIGEPQILGQLKDSYRYAVEYGTTGPTINRFLHKAFFVAKRTRTETKVATSTVSVSHAVVDLARKIFNQIADKKILLIGAGEMAELATQHLLSHGVGNLLIANRTSDKALQFASRFGGTFVPFEQIPFHLPDADIIICSTAASHFVITREQTREALRRRKNRPVFMFDIAVPRNIEPTINTLANVYLYNIDDLKGITETNKRIREEEASKAEEIIDRETDTFTHWLDQQQIAPTIVSLRDKLERIRRQELKKTISRWKGLTPAELERLDTLTAAIVNKILHDPISHLKGEAHTDDLAEAVKRLFNLNNDKQ